MIKLIVLKTNSWLILITIISLLISIISIINTPERQVKDQPIKTYHQDTPTLLIDAIEIKDLSFNSKSSFEDLKVNQTTGDTIGAIIILIIMIIGSGVLIYALLLL